MIQTLSLPYSETIVLPPLSQDVSWARLSFSGCTAPVKIFLDGQFILDIENYFREYHYILPLDGNLSKTLHFVFEDLQTFTQKRSDIWKTPMDENGFSYTHGYRYPFIRQPAYACGWDWCHPMQPKMRIETITLSVCTQLPIFADLFSVTSTFLNIIDLDCYFPYTLSDNFKRVEIAPNISFLSLDQAPLEFEISIDGHSIHHQFNSQNTEAFPTICINNPQLWYPNGYGEPYRYKVDVTIKNTITLEILEKSYWVGFKEVKLFADPHLRFEVNGACFPVRGANFIPTHIHGEGESCDKLSKLIHLAKENCFNTLRVWGGGYYESELFYNLCDELGLLVWQDFPFACNLYPENEMFQNEIKMEVITQLSRLRHHVSLGVLCGNNEVHSAYYEWLAYAKIPHFYGNIYFEKILPYYVALLAPHIPYWPGSPFDPVMTSTPSSQTAGDRHSWQCFFGEEHAKLDYRVLAEDQSMFVSEFGFIAPPNFDSLPSLLQSFEELDKVSNYGVPIERLKTYISQVCVLKEKSTLEEFCNLGQEAQAIMLGNIVDAWCKRGINGILLWHYNDISVSCSWGLIDGEMRPRKSLEVVKNIWKKELENMKMETLI